MSDIFYIERCFELARRGSGHTAPNPMVGAVLVHNDRIIGEGWHHYYGADHAEVNCLKNVREEDKALIPLSTMYVNLEPCAHYGITPPCATRLVQEQVKKVVIANTDPFTRVSGKGIAILKDAGIEVITGVSEKEGAWLNRRFFCFHSLQRPYIILKWAQTADDGYIAPADRSRLQISGTESSALVHKWRTQEGAIMVGTTTTINDNPQLTARLHEGRQPLRIVLDRSLSVPQTHNVYNTDAPTWIINEQQEALEGNVHLVQMTFDDTLLPQLMKRLHEQKILSLIVEGGAVLLNSFISSGLWDEARVFTGKMTLEHPGIQAPRLSNAREAMYTEIGNDELRLFVNPGSSWQYPAGEEL